MTTLIFFVGVLILILILYLLNLNKYKELDKFPGPSSLEVAKFMFFSEKNSDIHRYLFSLSKKYGPVVKLWIKPFTPTLIVTGGKYYEQLLLTKQHFQKPTTFDLLRPILGDGLGTMRDYAKWKYERKLINIAFNQKNVVAFFPKFKIPTKELIDDFNTNQNISLDVQPLILNCTLKIIYDILVSENVNSRGYNLTEYLKAMGGYLELLLERAYSSYLKYDFVYKHTKKWDNWVKLSGKVLSFVDNVIQEQIHLRKLDEESIKHDDMLAILLNANIPPDRLLAHMSTLMAGGSDTVGQTISFACFEIAKRKDIQEKIFGEYVSIVGHDKNSILEFHHLQKMAYLESVIKETLRMYTIIPIIQRRLSGPVTIDGKIVPPVDVFFSTAVLHNSSVYHNPQKFEPDRFSPENRHDIPQNAFVPFSLGQRDCPGRILTMVEAKYILSAIIRNFYLHPIVPEIKLQVATELVLTSKNGISIILQQRND